MACILHTSADERLGIVNNHLNFFVEYCAWRVFFSRQSAEMHLRNLFTATGAGPRGVGPARRKFARSFFYAASRAEGLANWRAAPDNISPWNLEEVHPFLLVFVSNQEDWSGADRAGCSTA